MMLKISVYTILIFLLGILSMVGWWMFYPYNPLDMKQPVIVSPKTYKVGDRLGLTMDYCSHVAVPVSTTAKFVLTGPSTDHVIDSTVQKTTVSKIGCKQVISNTFHILSNFIPGVYHLEIRAVYHVNPLRDIPVDIISEEFTVLP